MAAADVIPESKLSNRYDILFKPSVSFETTEGDSRPQLDYATFLKDKLRSACRNGYVDSGKYKKSYLVINEKKKRKSDAKDGKKLDAVKLASGKMKAERDFDRQISLIEGHMLQHKQQERQLKRIEGDVVKHQATLKSEMRKLENAMSKKQMAVETKLNKGLQTYKSIEKKYTWDKEALTKRRIQESTINSLVEKEQGRKVQLIGSQLAKDYYAKMQALNRKRAEADQLSSEFENRMRRKEEEQHKLKQELAELAIALNAEAQKGREISAGFQKQSKQNTSSRIQEDRGRELELDNSLAKSGHEIKHAEFSLRHISSEKEQRKEHLAMKSREAVRQKIDTQHQLKTNIREQKFLHEAANQEEIDLKSRKSQMKLAAVNNKHQVISKQMCQERQERKRQYEEMYSAKAKVRLAEEQKQVSDHNMLHMEKSVYRGEEREQELYRKVKDAEYKEQQKQKHVNILHEKLMELRRKTKARLNLEMKEARQEEDGLQQTLQLEKAELDKLHARREEQYMQLASHRVVLKADRHLFDEHEREAQHRLRVAEATNRLAEVEL